jgi:ketosteroid isomerase-like protein
VELRFSRHTLVNHLPALNRCLSWILALFAISLLPYAGHAEVQSASGAVPEQEICAAEAQLATALSNVDVDALSRLWADDFVSTMADGRVTTGKKRLESLRKQKPDANSHVTNENQQVDVHVQGDWALVLVTSSWVASGKPVGSQYQATHIWAKRNGQWRLIAAHISEVKS